MNAAFAHRGRAVFLSVTAVLLLLLSLPATGGKALAQGQSDTFRFVVMGDSRSVRGFGKNWDSYINGPVLSRINDRILSLDPRPALIVFSGDLVYRGGEKPLRAWKKIMEPVTEAGIPLYVVVGNHEISTGKGGSDIDGQIAFQKEFPSLPGNGPAGYKGLVYSFEYGNAFFAVLDTHWVEPDPPFQTHNYRIQEAQLTWLKEKLDATTKPHRFVFAHAPAFSAQKPDRYTGYDRYKFPLWTILDAGCVDIYFSGHEHLYARRRIDGTAPHSEGNPWLHSVIHMITGSAGAPLVSAGGRADVIAKEYHFAVVDVAGDSVSVHVYSEQGNLLDRLSLVKACRSGGK